MLDSSTPLTSCQPILGYELVGQWFLVCLFMATLLSFSKYSLSLRQSPHPAPPAQDVSDYKNDRWCDSTRRENGERCASEVSARGGSVVAGDCHAEINLKEAIPGEIDIQGVIESAIARQEETNVKDGIKQGVVQRGKHDGRGEHGHEHDKKMVAAIESLCGQLMATQELSDHRIRACHAAMERLWEQMERLSGELAICHTQVAELKAELVANRQEMATLTSRLAAGSEKELSQVHAPRPSPTQMSPPSPQLRPLSHQLPSATLSSFRLEAPTPSSSGILPSRGSSRSLSLELALLLEEKPPGPGRINSTATDFKIGLVADDPKLPVMIGFRHWGPYAPMLPLEKKDDAMVRQLWSTCGVSAAIVMELGHKYLVQQRPPRASRSLSLPSIPEESEKEDLPRAQEADKEELEHKEDELILCPHIEDEDLPRAPLEALRVMSADRSGGAGKDKYILSSPKTPMPDSTPPHTPRSISRLVIDRVGGSPTRSSAPQSPLTLAIWPPLLSEETPPSCLASRSLSNK